MEAIGLTAALIGLVNSTKTLARDIFALAKDLQSDNAASEIHVYTLLLEELSDIILKGADVSPSAVAAAKLCQERLIGVQTSVSASKPDAGSIQAALFRFHGSVMLLRDMVMEFDNPYSNISRH